MVKLGEILMWAWLWARPDPGRPRKVWLRTYLRANSHTRLKAHDHSNLRSLIGRKGEDHPSSLLTWRWRPKGPKKTSWMKKSTWSRTWQTMDKVLWSSGLFVMPNSWKRWVWHKLTNHDFFFGQRICNGPVTWSISHFTLCLRALDYITRLSQHPWYYGSWMRVKGPHHYKATALDSSCVKVAVSEHLSMVLDVWLGGLGRNEPHKAITGPTTRGMIDIPSIRVVFFFIKLRAPIQPHKVLKIPPFIWKIVTKPCITWVCCLKFKWHWLILCNFRDSNRVSAVSTSCFFGNEPLNTLP